MAEGQGRIAQILGNVIDVEFPEGDLPDIFDALRVPRCLALPAILGMGDRDKVMNQEHGAELVPGKPRSKIWRVQARMSDIEVDLAGTATVCPHGRCRQSRHEF